MQEQISRRESLKRGLTVSTLFALADLATPALAEGETDIPFTDYPATYNPNGNPNAAAHLLDIRKIDGMITPVDQFFFTQHYNRPEIDPNTYRLKLTGMVNKPMELALTDLKGMK